MAEDQRNSANGMPAEEDVDAVEIFDPDTVLPEEELSLDDLEGLDAEEDLLSEEDDDNPYNDSDEALPDDAEEAAIRRDLSSQDDPDP